MSILRIKKLSKGWFFLKEENDRPYIKKVGLRKFGTPKRALQEGMKLASQLRIDEVVLAV